MNIEKLSSMLAQLSPLKVNSSACSRAITPKSACTKCEDVCPNNAIIFNKDQLTIAQCLYCGKCVTACPNDVFRLELNLKTADNTLFFSCSPYLDQFKKIDKSAPICRCNCLSQLHPELLVNLLAHKQRLIFFLDSSQCQQCFAFSLDALYQNLKVYSKAWPDLLQDKFIIIKKPDELNSYLQQCSIDNMVDESRRHLFHQMFQSAKVMPAKVASNTLDKFKDQNDHVQFTVPLGLSVRKHYLKTACQSQPPAHPDAPLPFKTLRASDCIFCGVCHRLCPTGAMQQRQKDGLEQLIYAPHLCNHCDICTTVCYPQALKWQEPLTAQDLAEKTIYLIAKGHKPTPPKSTFTAGGFQSER